MGNYSNGRLHLSADGVITYNADRTDPLPEVPASDCGTSRCRNCMGSQERNRTVNFAYIPGDILIGASFSVHKPGESPLTCGEIDKEDGAVMAQAFLYGLQQIAESGIFPRRLRIGGIVVDDCGSPELGRAALAGLKTGRWMGSVLPEGSDKIQAFIGGQTNDLADAFGEALETLEVPFVSFRADGIQDADNLVSLIPEKSKQIRPLVLAMKQLGWHYIQVVAQSGKGDALKDFTEAASVEEICVAASFEADGNELDRVAAALSVKASANVVFVIGDPDFYRSLAAAVSVTGRRYTFLYNAVTNPQSAASSFLPEGAITVSTPLTTMNGFFDFLSELDPTSYSENVWFREWYEDVFDCVIDEVGSSSRERCMTGTPITQGPDFSVNPLALPVVNALYAVSWGLDATLTAYCGEGYGVVCGRYLNAEGRADNITRLILDQTFTDVTGNRVTFSGRSANTLMEVRLTRNGEQIKVRYMIIPHGFNDGACYQAKDETHGPLIWKKETVDAVGEIEASHHK